MQLTTSCGHQPTTEAARIKELIKEVETLLPPKKETPYNILSGQDQVSLLVSKELSKYPDLPPFTHKFYFQYATLPEDTQIEPNLLHTLESNAKTILALTSNHLEKAGICFPHIKNQGWELWWDNAPVDFTYEPNSDTPFLLSFQNGRTLTADANLISKCSELSSNIQLSIASCIAHCLNLKLDLSKTRYNKVQQTYSFLDVLENTLIESRLELLMAIKKKKHTSEYYQLENTEITLNTNSLEFNIPGIDIKSKLIAELILVSCFTKQLS